MQLYAASIIDNVYVIDSQRLSSGIDLLAIYARKLADKGLEPEEIVKKVTKRIPYVQASFVINSLSCLRVRISQRKDSYRPSNALRR